MELRKKVIEDYEDGMQVPLISQVMRVSNQRYTLIFLNESGVKINMTRRYDRAKNKQRAVDSAPLNTPKSTTIVYFPRRYLGMVYCIWLLEFLSGIAVKFS